MINLYVLLVGINDYPNAPLKQCISDVEKVKIYCESLSSMVDGTVTIQTLLNDRATKKSITNQLVKILKILKKEDTFLLYFSGHGAQENANNRFIEEQDNLLECLVCYPEKDQTKSNLLADKELQYLLSTCKTQAHIVTIFDCCHSGDMVRSDNTLKRLSKVFPARPYEEFVFAPTQTEQQLKAEGFLKRVPFINSIHIAACQSNQSAWENEKGGVFTYYLLRLLKESHSHLSYQFITQWIKINIRDNTLEKQVPTISIQGAGRFTASSSWLGLYPDKTIDNGLIFYKENKGWYLNRGILFGLRIGRNVSIKNAKGLSIDGIIGEVDLEDAQVQFAEERLLDVTKVYPLDTTLFYRPLRLHLLDLYQGSSYKTTLNKIINEENNISFVSKEECDFLLVLSKQLIYITLPHTPFQALTDPISSNLKLSELSTTLLEDLSLLRKWNHFYHLKNEKQNDQPALIQVELVETENSKKKDITNNSYTLSPQSKRAPNKEWYSQYKIKVTNKTNKNLYILVLTLGSNISITSKPYDNQCIILPSGKSKFFYDHLPEPIAWCSLDTYKELFNWEKEWFHYKFLINDRADISTSIPFFLQGTSSPNVRGIVLREKKDQKSTWTTYTSTIQLENPSYNIFDKEKAKILKKHLDNPRIAPLIMEIYPTLKK